MSGNIISLFQQDVSVCMELYSRKAMKNTILLHNSLEYFALMLKFKNTTYKCKIHCPAPYLPTWETFVVLSLSGRIIQGIEDSKNSDSQVATTIEMPYFRSKKLCA